MLYNVVYTGAIPIIVGLLEQNVGSKVLLDNPIFYNRSSNNELYNKTNLFLVILDSCKFLSLRWAQVTPDDLGFLVYQSGVQFALLYFSYLNTSGVLDHPLTTDSTTPDSTISILHFGQLQTMVLLITWVLESELFII